MQKAKNFNRRKRFKERRKEKHCKNKKDCRDPGIFRARASPPDLNQGPSDLQSDALPTELSRQHALNYQLSLVQIISYVFYKNQKKKPLVIWFFLPSKVQKEFLKALCQKDRIFLSSPPGQLIDSVAGQRVYWWIDVTKCKLISGNLSVWRHVRLAKEKQQLIFGKLRIHFAEGEHVKG